MGNPEFTQAQHALIDPLVEPDPSDETGLNSHFTSTFAPRQNLTPPHSAGLEKGPSAHIRHQSTGSSTDTNPYRRKRASLPPSQSPSLVDYKDPIPYRPQNGYPSPPKSASPRRAQFPSNHRSEALGTLNEGRPRRSSQPSSSYAPYQDSNFVRRSSLRERYPGDKSVRPLDTIRQDTKVAHRAHHLRKKNFHGTDTIDRLDNAGFGGYHHEGPFDAANLSRNTVWKHSPVAAVRDTNDEALKATPRENIVDAVSKHRPLEGVATVPPGMPDKFGRVLDYEEGADLHREPGADYRRWPGQKYAKDDLKGKGEPSFSIDKAIKDHKAYGDDGVEMSTRRRRNQSMGANDAPESVPLQSPFDDSNRLGRSNTTGKGMGNKLKSRFGSLRRRRGDTQAA